MTIRIVTDSTADLPADLARELDITIAPLYVRFGDVTFRDGVDINHDEFYDKLLHGQEHPRTAQPPPQDFVDLYESLADNCEGILSIHISKKFSGTYSSAVEGAKLAEVDCPIEVIDSLSLSMGMGLTVIEAAMAAQAGKSLNEIVEHTNQIIPKINVLGFFDTLRYVEMGGRLGKARSLLGSILGVKPVLTVKDGEYYPSGRVRSREKGVEKLIEFAKTGKDIQAMSVIHSTTPEEAKVLAERIDPVFPKEKIIIARLGPVLGAHGGPGTLWVGYREK